MENQDPNRISISIKLAIVSAIVIVLVHFVLFFLGYINENTLLIDTIGFTAGIILITVAFEERKRMSYSPQ
ncbi:MAG: hypothetical protein ABSD42_11940 [Candidatus Bathyarchaeia archaeon]|jgi:ABC-type multidrug transport system permease subunit